MSALQPKSEYHEFLNPLSLPTTLDIFVARRGILEALRLELQKFNGTVLDVGCGYMPYKSLILAPPSRAESYIGLDLKDNIYQRPDVEWDGHNMPFKNNSVDCALATEVFEHCPDPEIVMCEILRVLKPGGFLFFTVPFLWPLHCVPHDEYRYTPFALKRHLQNSGFEQITLNPLGGWDASLAQMLGLWALRRPMSSRKRAILSRLALPVIRFLVRRDCPPKEFNESCMITGLSGTATKPAV
jgi:SAM-dependent methyltransferase